MTDNNWNPAFIADASIYDAIRYTVQTLDTSGERPVVVDTVHTTIIRSLRRVVAQPSTYYVWTDADGNEHRNAANFHIELLTGN